MTESDFDQEDLMKTEDEILMSCDGQIQTYITDGVRLERENFQQKILILQKKIAKSDSHTSQTKQIMEE